jgi:hypothetical protein
MMKDLSCTYQTIGPATGNQSDQENIKIMQLFVENGQIAIGERQYPIVYGDLYFIDANQCYSIIDTEDELVQSTIEVSAKQLKKLAKALDFEAEYEKIFERKGSFHVASPRYKAIDKRFKEAASVCNDTKVFARPLFFSRVFELLNYAVVTMEKNRKNF